MPERHESELLGLYAVFAALEECVVGVSDELVAQTKLNWWVEQFEFLAQSGDGKQVPDHPILRQLHHCNSLGPSHIPAYCAIAVNFMKRLHPDSPADLAELEQLCVDIGIEPLKLEIRLYSSDNESTSDQLIDQLTHASQNNGSEVIGWALDGEESNWRALAAANGLLQLIRESSLSEHQRFWWLPMSFLAKYQTSRTGLATFQWNAQRDHMMNEISELGLQWGRDGQSVFSCSGNYGEAPEVSRWRNRHLIMNHAWNIRLLERLGKSPAKLQQGIRKGANAIDMLAVWSKSRKILKRGKA